MNYQESLDYIKSLTPTLEKPTLARIKLYFEELGNPQNQLQCFHVGGTNGKGSVTTFLASMVAACGKKVAKFTGPHLVKFNERLVVNGRDIDDERFASVAGEVLTLSDQFARRHPEFGPLTWFEFLTAMAVHYFNQEKVDFAVFEVGLGGRFDATNVLQNILVSTITNIDLDHMHLLGDTVEAIAFEKAGIIKTAPLVTAASGNALPVLEKQAMSQGAPVVAIDVSDGGFSAQIFKRFALKFSGADENFKQTISKRVELLRSKIFTDDLHLSGAYQRLNALTALISLAASDFFDQQWQEGGEKFFSDLRLGLNEAYWPGRFEIAESEGLILDGAHNPHGARALRFSLDDMFEGKSFIFLFACFQNKNARSLLEGLLRPGDCLIAPVFAGERPFHDFTDIETICKNIGVQSIRAENFVAGLALARRILTENKGHYADKIVVTGSFGTVREAKASSR